MKRTYAADKAGMAALKHATAVNVEIDDDVVDRLGRAEHLIRAAGIEQIGNAVDQMMERQTEMEAARLRATLDYARTSGVREKYLAIVEAAQPSEEIIDLMENPQPLVTGLLWDELNVPARYKQLSRLGLPLELVTSTVLGVLPEASKRYLLRWQDQLNRGAPWHLDDIVRRRVTRLITEGFLLLGQEPFVALGAVAAPGRTTEPGLPGSRAFVKAIMGREYLDWLLANEAHPIDV